MSIDMSPFQLIHNSIAEFKYVKASPLPVQKKDIVDHFSFSKEIRFDPDKECLVGIIMIQYEASVENAPSDNPPFSLEVCNISAFSFAGQDTDENREHFSSLLKLNGAFNALSTLRSHVAAATTALGLAPGYQIPFINLNSVEWSD
ncbi:MAG: hypothetical protein IKW00_06235 [Clostridia bacterium]|nr:hypothetical protein [Clostridia bacterium]